MNRIEAKMKALQEKGEKAFITYITAGLPDLEGTKKLLKAQEEAGLDVVELGIPFSDPVADGPVIQDASYKAICNGINLKKSLCDSRGVEKRRFRASNRLYDVLQHHTSLWGRGICEKM